MSLQPVTGVNTINNILKIFGFHIPLTWPAVNVISKFILTRELNMYFSRIRKEDESITFDCVDKEFTEE